MVSGAGGSWVVGGGGEGEGELKMFGRDANVKLL